MSGLSMNLSLIFVLHFIIFSDNAYMDKEIYKHMLLTAWIPLLDANEQNGCMQVGVTAS